MDKIKNVFISHFHKDGEHVQKLKNLLLSKGLTLKNSSVDNTKPNRAISEEYVRRLLRLRIQWAGTVIVLIGPRTHTRDWVDWEIEQAHLKGKPIIGIYINGASKVDIPENLKKYGRSIVNWTSDKIIEAISGKINYENPGGNEMEPLWVSKTSEC